MGRNCCIHDWRISNSTFFAAGIIGSLVVLHTIYDADTSCGAQLVFEDRQNKSLGAAGQPKAVEPNAQLSVGNVRTDKPKPSPFEKRLLEIGKEYRSFRRVDDESQLARASCVAPGGSVSQYSMARDSASKDDATHGRKLYFVFAKDRLDYVFGPDLAAEAKRRKTPGQPRQGSPVGQVLVKEAWHPEKVSEEEVAAGRLSGNTIVPKVLPDRAGPCIPFARIGQNWFKTGAKGDLFVMLKLDPSTPDTDQGWVYGTLTPDGGKVTSAGRVESCMKCHQTAKNDRVFGLASSYVEKEVRFRDLGEGRKGLGGGGLGGGRSRKQTGVENRHMP